MVLSAVLPEQVEQVGFYLRKIFRCLDRDLAFLLPQEGLTLPQMIVLRQVQVQNDTTLAELTEKLQWAASTLSGIIKRLERDGFLRRQPDPTDLRVYRLQITDKAKVVLKKTCAAYSDHLACILLHFSVEDITVLLSSLQTLWQAVQREQPRRN